MKFSPYFLLVLILPVLLSNDQALDANTLLTQNALSLRPAYPSRFEKTLYGGTPSRRQLLAIVLGAPAAQAEPSITIERFMHHVWIPFFSGVNGQRRSAKGQKEFYDQLRRWSPVGAQLAAHIQTVVPTLESNDPKFSRELIDLWWKFCEEHLVPVNWYGFFLPWHDGHRFRIATPLYERKATPPQAPDEVTLHGKTIPLWYVDTIKAAAPVYKTMDTFLWGMPEEPRVVVLMDHFRHEDERQRRTLDRNSYYDPYDASHPMAAYDTKIAGWVRKTLSYESPDRKLKTDAFSKLFPSLLRYELFRRARWSDPWMLQTNTSVSRYLDELAHKKNIHPNLLIAIQNQLAAVYESLAQDDNPGWTLIRLGRDLIQGYEGLKSGLSFIQFNVAYLAINELLESEESQWMNGQEGHKVGNHILHLASSPLVVQRRAKNLLRHFRPLQGAA